MTFWLINIVAVLLLCIVCSGIIIPQILLISFRKHLFDEPDPRKIHTLPVPRLGGLAFMPVVFFATVLVFAIESTYSNNMFINEVLPEISTFSFFACAVLILYVVGMADDLIGIKYRAKFAAQVLCVIFMILGGVWIDNWTGILGFYEVSPWFGIPFTLVVAVYITNAINLIDGVDGLASGLCSIALLTYGVVYFLLGQYVYAILAAGTLGVLIPFYFYNVFGDARKRKKIFMGDTGSLTIGMVIAFLSIHMIQTPSSSAIWNANMAAIAFVPLLIPCFDVLRVYGERIVNHKNPFLPDKRHIHHKLLDLGFSQRRTMVCIVIAQFLFTAVNVWLSMFVNITVLLFGNMALWVFVMIGINKAIESHKRDKAADAQA